MRAATSAAETPAALNRRLVLNLPIAIGFVALGFALLVRGAAFTGPLLAPWDDAYMYVRYLDNLRATGVLSWNPGGPGTYGLTAPLYLLAVAPFRLLLPDNASLALVLASGTCGFVFLGLLSLLIVRGLPRADGGWRLPLLGVLVALMVSIRPLAAHFTSGLDTTFAMAYLTGYLWLALRFEAAPGVARAGILGVVGGLAIGARPDLMLTTVMIPAVLSVMNPTPGARPMALLALGVTFAILAAWMATAAALVHSPVPLPFFIKGATSYGPTIRREFRFVGIEELVWFVESHRLVFVAIVAGLVFARGSWRERRPAVDFALLVSCLGFMTYYAFFVLQILNDEQRFYQPILPAVLWLFARAIQSLAARVPDGIRRPVLDWVDAQGAARVVMVGTVLGIMAVPHELVDGSVRAAIHLARGTSIRYEPLAQYRAFSAHSNWWYRLDRFSTLPEDLVIATTELGMPSSLNPRKKIVDLSGLNTTELARGRSTVAQLIARDRPDLVYMPQPSYKEMIESMLADSAFRADYQVLPGARIGATMGIALRRGSRHIAAMREIAGILP